MFSALLLVLAGSARAGELTAVVEDISAPGVNISAFEFLEPGRRFDLARNGRAVIGYLRSCQREIIVGGQVVIGAKQSAVVGGKVQRSYVECDGGKMNLSADQAGKGAVTVFRKAPGQKSRRIRPVLTLFGASPFVSLTAGATVIIFERLDKPGGAITVQAKGKLVDLAVTGHALEPGGTYRLIAGDRKVIIDVDAFAKSGRGPIVPRLIKL